MIVRSIAPLRLGLAGGGTDLNTYCDRFGGYVLNASISLYVHCTIKLTNNNMIIFNAQDIDESIEVDSSTHLELNIMMDLYKGVYNRIVRDYVHRPMSFELYKVSDIKAARNAGVGFSILTENPNKIRRIIKD